MRTTVSTAGRRAGRQHQNIELSVWEVRSSQGEVHSKVRPSKGEVQEICGRDRKRVRIPWKRPRVRIPRKRPFQKLLPAGGAARRRSTEDTRQGEVHPSAGAKWRRGEVPEAQTGGLIREQHQGEEPQRAKSGEQQGPRHRTSLQRDIRRAAGS